MPSARKRRERERAARRRRNRTLGAVAAGALVLLGVAVVATRSSDGDTALPQIRPVEVVGDPLPAFDPTVSDPAVGMTAPRLVGSSFDGTPVEVTDDGRPKAIWFLAHWCPHCRAEVPRIVDLVAGGGIPDGVDPYSVSTAVDANEANYPPSTWLEREGWTIPVLADDDAGSAARAYGLSGFPFLVLVDGSGKVVARASGEVDPAVISQMLGQLANG
jgi:thiol-disulfide isomerase/thioredoxin